MSNGISENGGRVAGHWTKKPPKGCELFGYCNLEEFDLYWICYDTEEPLNKETRQKLKELGWRLERHSRTKCEMWTFDKPEAQTYYEAQSRQHQETA